MTRELSAKLDEIQALYEKATKGPWHLIPATGNFPAYICADPNDYLISEIAVVYGAGRKDTSNADASLIPALVNTWPLLLEHLRAGEKEASPAAAPDAGLVESAHGELVGLAKRLHELGYHHYAISVERAALALQTARAEGVREGMEKLVREAELLASTGASAVHVVELIRAASKEMNG